MTQNRLDLRTRRRNIEEDLQVLNDLHDLIESSASPMIIDTTGKQYLDEAKKELENMKLKGYTTEKDAKAFAKQAEKAATRAESKISEACRELEKQGNPINKELTASYLSAVKNRYAQPREKVTLFSSFVDRIREGGQRVQNYAARKTQEIENAQGKVSAEDLKNLAKRGVSEVKSKVSSMASGIYGRMLTPDQKMKSAVDKLDEKLREIEKYYRSGNDTIPEKIKKDREFVNALKNKIKNKKLVNPDPSMLNAISDRLDDTLAGIRFDKKHQKK